MNESINRFIEIQKKEFNDIFQELKRGKKISHWMWYIFPQIKGLGKSYIANYYAINDIKEAKEYFKNDYLRNNYLALCNVLINLDTNNPIEIFGDLDSLKLKSSLTLFYLVSKNNSILNVLNKYYNGELDEYTKKYLIEFLMLSED